MALGASPDDPRPLRIRFDGVADLRLAELGVHGSISLVVTDIRDRQLDGLRFAVANGGCGSGELSFLCAAACVMP